MDLSSELEYYDYIICGGGTSGCVVAGRLAENPNVKILLIEAGQHNKDLENVHMVGGWSNNFDSETDWNVVTPPMKGIDNRQVKLSRGKFLGGCSGCNGTLCIRGSKQDFDDWELEGWSGEEFFGYMRKAETFHPKPWFDANEQAHGYDGPLHTEPHDLAPISQLIMSSFVSEGLPHVPDMFSTGETPHGCGHAPRSVYNGLRTTSADFVTNGFIRKNVTVVTGSTVDHVLVEPDAQTGELVARSVLVQDTFSGDVRAYHAKREVVICGGAYCSPAILLRSGIGPKSELEKHDIPCVVDSPGVGQNLMDHPIVFIFYETAHPNLTTDHLVYHKNAFETTYNLWKTNKTGFLSTFPFGAFAYARLDDRLANEPLWKEYQNTSKDKQVGNEKRDPMYLLPSKQPNIELFTTECYGGPKQYDHFPASPNRDANVFSIIAELFSPHSRGSVTLSSRDGRENPVVDCNYLDHPLDMLVLSEGVRFANEIVMNGAGTKGIVKGSWPEGLGYGTPGKERFRTREDWVPYVKEHATTCYHAAGTCAMGKDDNPMAVLDNKLRVRGVANLRVADCSIMPTLHGGHTQMPAYGIGEKCADLIKETWSTDNVSQGLRAVL
ncbi:GMC family oxidoreductase [Aspergillus ruber CBS 135680]|uniref:Putative GMC oxidoreductase n=1 Tax=Aspergillus ruber (strain CBS 135680) TaxID=1388766 RepID=A0A017S1E6_ASPRC|nr:putative GMC oxidoreductase [Aspergillus ruber CBS 135680]EYE89980.1 putative GMC oxidoreductase [Aspergillus ruber CBS 135680]